jgi:hypothetical protein
LGSAICFGDSLSFAGGEIHIVATVIEAVYFTAIMFKEVVDFVILVITGLFVGNGFLRVASGSEHQNYEG